VANRERVFDRLARPDANVAIAGRPPSGAHLQSVSFMDNTMAVMASPEDAMTEWDTADAAALGERTWLPRGGLGARACNEAFLARHEISPRTLTLGSNGANREVAPSRLGILLVSRVTAALELDAGLLGTRGGRVAGAPLVRREARRAVVEAEDERQQDQRTVAMTSGSP
jgi:hypothetical protein